MNSRWRLPLQELRSSSSGSLLPCFQPSKRVKPVSVYSLSEGWKNVLYCRTPLLSRGESSYILRSKPLEHVPIPLPKPGTSYIFHISELLVFCKALKLFFPAFSFFFLIKNAFCSGTAPSFPIIALAFGLLLPGIHSLGTARRNFPRCFRLLHWALLPLSYISYSAGS